MAGLDVGAVKVVDAIVYRGDGEVASQKLGPVTVSRDFDASGWLSGETATGAGSTPPASTSNDAPLPGWALVALAGLLGTGLRRARRGAGRRDEVR